MAIKSRTIKRTGLRLVMCLLLLPACIEAFQCGSSEGHPGDDPCDCPAIIVTINDTILQGDEITVFNTTGTLSSPCAIFRLTDAGSLILNLRLRDPCFEGEITECKLNCAGTDKSVYPVIGYADIHAPEFPFEIYNTSVPEDVPIGEIVLDIINSNMAPTDEDCNVQFNYQLVGDGDGHFAIQQGSTGDITTARNLDFEENAMFELIVEVTSNNRMATATIIVQLEDVDDNDPTFDHVSYDLEIKEEEVSSEWTITTPPVFCYDADTDVNTTVYYSFEGYQNDTDFLRIDPTSGMFSAIAAVDREIMAQNPMSILIWCYQGDIIEKTASAALNVTITDINDKAAVFDPVLYEHMLQEHRTGYITTVTATDLDLGDNAAIIYEIYNDTGIFSVLVDTGDVSVRNSTALDRETLAVHTILIVARDLQGNYSENTATVMVTLLDINDNPPVFDTDRYVFDTQATEDGDIVGTIIATDADEAGTPNANVTYEIKRSWSPSPVPFDIDVTVGNITVAGETSNQQEYSFFVSACDNPDVVNTRRCTEVNVIVLVSWNSSFTDHHISMEVIENMPGQSPIGVIPVPGEKYECSPDMFSVDPVSHSLMALSQLDREENDTHEIHVQVFQYDQVIANVSISLQVLDLNDNAPFFFEPDYIFNLPTSISANQSVGHIQADDVDLGENSFLQYGLNHVNDRLFTVDAATGVLRTGDGWSEPASRRFSVYQFLGVATDQGNPQLQTSVSIVVTFMDLIDNHTVRLQTPLTVDVLLQHRHEIETGIASVLELSHIFVNEVLPDSGQEESTVVSFIHLTATNETPVLLSNKLLMRKLIENWSAVQELFRQYMTVTSLPTSKSDDNMSTSEIALIAIAGAIFVGTIVLIAVVCKQWKSHVKEQNLYESLRRPSVMYDSQELRMDFGDEFSSRFNTFRGEKRTDSEVAASFGSGFVNSAYALDVADAGVDDVTETDVKTLTPTWNVGDTPRIPRWSTSDSLKDAIQSLEDLTSRLNTEDSLSRVTTMSRERRSQWSEPTTPRGGDPCQTQSADSTMRSDAGPKPPNDTNYANTHDIPVSNLVNDDGESETPHKRTAGNGYNGDYIGDEPPVDYPMNIGEPLEAKRNGYVNAIGQNDGTYTDSSEMTSVSPRTGVIEVTEQSTAF